MVCLRCIGIDAILRGVPAGAQLVRLTVQGNREAEACMKIKEVTVCSTLYLCGFVTMLWQGCLKRGYTTPLVADMHFAPKVLSRESCSVPKTGLAN